MPEEDVGSLELEEAHVSVELRFLEPVMSRLKLRISNSVGNIACLSSEVFGI